MSDSRFVKRLTAVCPGRTGRARSRERAGRARRLSDSPFCGELYRNPCSPAFEKNAKAVRAYDVLALVTGFLLPTSRAPSPVF